VTRPDGAQRHFTLIRSFHLADFLTLGNAACGVASVLLAMQYLISGEAAHFYWAALMAPLAGAFDVADGRVARARHQHSALGRELDSLADIISFGVGPATLGFAAGLRGGWDAMVLVYFVCCGVSRLARYNVTAESLSAGADKVAYFEGTPIPTSIAITGALAAIAGWAGLGAALPGGVWQIGPWQLHPLVALFALSGTLMISKTLHVPKF
jgi:CDP-diacylglycerol--serine O-phosphatidyltransferase